MRHIALVIADRPMASSGCGPWFILSPGWTVLPQDAVPLECRRIQRDAPRRRGRAYSTLTNEFVRRAAPGVVDDRLAPSNDWFSDDDAERGWRGNYLLEGKAGPLKQVAEFGSSTLPSRGHHHHVQVHPLAHIELGRFRDHRLHHHQARLFRGDASHVRQKANGFLVRPEGNNTTHHVAARPHRDVFEKGSADTLHSSVLRCFCDDRRLIEKNASA